jgi:hypothetical protein
LLTYGHSCIAIHGWGSHALGGFKAHDDTYVWLRDSLTKDVPRLRVFIYGYACDLTTADSISTVDDYADTLRRLLRDMRSQKKVGALEIRLHIVADYEDRTSSTPGVHCSQPWRNSPQTGRFIIKKCCFLLTVEGTYTDEGEF